VVGRECEHRTLGTASKNESPEEKKTRIGKNSTKLRKIKGEEKGNFEVHQPKEMVFKRPARGKPNQRFPKATGGGGRSWVRVKRERVEQGRVYKQKQGRNQLDQVLGKVASKTPGGNA